MAKLHVFYEIAFGQLYRLDLVSISLWTIMWHGIGLWIHPGIKRSRGLAGKITSLLDEDTQNTARRRRNANDDTLTTADPRLRLMPG